MSHFTGTTAAKVLRIEVLLSVIEFDISRLLWLHNKYEDNPEMLEIITMVGNTLLHIQNEVRAIE